jgi:hypothetical protein
VDSRSAEPTHTYTVAGQRTRRRDADDTNGDDVIIDDGAVTAEGTEMTTAQRPSLCAKMLARLRRMSHQ